MLIILDRKNSILRFAPKDLRFIVLITKLVYYESSQGHLAP